ncbi:hypothetical protein FKM82_018442 [Ascaphus truei]
MYFFFIYIYIFLIYLFSLKKIRRKKKIGGDQRGAWEGIQKQSTKHLKVSLKNRIDEASEGRKEVSATGAAIERAGSGMERDAMCTLVLHHTSSLTSTELCLQIKNGNGKKKKPSPARSLPPRIS